MLSLTYPSVFIGRKKYICLLQYSHLVFLILSYLIISGLESDSFCQLLPYEIYINILSCLSYLLDYPAVTILSFKIVVVNYFSVGKWFDMVFT